MIAISFWVAVIWPGSDGAVLACIAAVIFTGLVANLIVRTDREIWPYRTPKFT
jgi:hypothetical protein